MFNHSWQLLKYQAQSGWSPEQVGSIEERCCSCLLPESFICLDTLLSHLCLQLLVLGPVSMTYGSSIKGHHLRLFDVNAWNPMWKLHHLKLSSSSRYLLAPSFTSHEFFFQTEGEGFVISGVVAFKFPSLFNSLHTFAWLCLCETS